MGCSNTRENLENEIMQMQIKRLEIQMEKYNKLQKLSEIEKHKVKPNIIPDYILPKFSKEKKIHIKNSKDKKSDSDKSDKTNVGKEKKVTSIKKKDSRKSKVKMN